MMSLDEFVKAIKAADEKTKEYIKEILEDTEKENVKKVTEILKDNK